MPVIYSAHWLLPIIHEPIENGAIAVEDSQIVAVGARTEVLGQFPDARVHDFGEAAIIPGLVNTHSHLELTAMRGFLEAEEEDFFAWLRKLTIARMSMTSDDLVISATCGAIEAARAGITCVGDSSSSAIDSMKALQDAGLRGIVYQESFGPDPNFAPMNVRKLREQVDSMFALQTNLVRAGVSPHAPYTVSAPQLELISRMAIDEKLPLMMHAAESEAERLFMLKGEGAFADGLRKRGIEWYAPGLSSIQYLDRHGVMDTKPLLAHCIHVDDADIELINQRNAGIAHCPKSNAKLRHGRAPLGKFLEQKVKVGLGSDSVASNNTCDILEEARFATLLARMSESQAATFANNVARDEDLLPALPDGRASDTMTATDALFTATLGGACALGLDDQIGALKAGMQADIAIVTLAGPHQIPARDPAEALIFSSSGRDVIMTIIAGKEVYRDGRVTAVDEGSFGRQLRVIRAKIEQNG